MKWLVDYYGLLAGVDEFTPSQAQLTTQDDFPKPQCNQDAPQNAKGGGKIVVSQEREGNDFQSFPH